MPTAARKWRAFAALLVLSAAKPALSDYATPGTPGLPQPGQTAAAATQNQVEIRRWTVAPSIDVRETYTDNAFVGSFEPRSDWVTQVTPAIRIDGRSPRLTAHLNYAPSALFYANNKEANDVANFLDAFARLEAVEKFFFVEGAANVTQNFITPFAAQPGDLTINTPNRFETRTLSLSPYVRHEGRDLEYELRNRNIWTSSNSAGLGKFRTERWTGQLTRPVRLFGATLEFDSSNISYYDSLVERPEDKSRLYRGRLYYQPDPAWRLSASAGSEENNYVLQQMQRTSIYGAGLAWRPSPRTSADLAYENRFFGPSRLARFAHRSRLSDWSLTYSRNTSTFQEEVLRLPPGSTAALLDGIFAARIADPDQRRAAVEQFMRASGTPASLSNSLAFYTQRVYVREGVDASFAILGARNSIAFTAFAVESSDISADALGVLPDALLLARRIKQRGFGVSASHRLTPSTSIGASANRVYSREEQPLQIDSRNDYFNVLLTSTVSPKTITYAGVSVSKFDSDDPSFLTNQDATSVFVGLNHRF
jgi:uncharacterized protein (PEP-CTERM system associated)